MGTKAMYLNNLYQPLEWKSGIYKPFGTNIFCMMIDLTDLAFRLAAIGTLRGALEDARMQHVEPIMNVKITAPDEFQRVVMIGINKRNGTILGTSGGEGYLTVDAEVALNDMFGYSTEIRSLTRGKGEYTMEYCKYLPCRYDVQEKLMQEYQAQDSTASKKKAK